MPEIREKDVRISDFAPGTLQAASRWDRIEPGVRPK